MRNVSVTRRITIPVHYIYYRCNSHGRSNAAAYNIIRIVRRHFQRECLATLYLGSSPLFQIHISHTHTVVLLSVHILLHARTLTQFRSELSECQNLVLLYTNARAPLPRPLRRTQLAAPARARRKVYNYI